MLVFMRFHVGLGAEASRALIRLHNRAVKRLKSEVNKHVSVKVRVLKLKRKGFTCEFDF